MERMNKVSSRSQRITHDGKSGNSLWWRIKRYRSAYFFIIPTMLLLLVFNYYPALSAMYHSLTMWNGFTPPTFVGLENFIEVFTDPVMKKAFSNLILLAIWRVLLTLTVPLLVAELIFAVKGEAAQHRYRLLFVIPLVVPRLVTYLLWQFIYEPNVGLLNSFFAILGKEGWQRAWLGDPKIALYAFMFMGFPWVDGVAVLIYLAGLQAIPKDIYDAALIDGASIISRFFRIDLPLIMGQIKLMVVLSIIGVLQGFEGQLVLTDGGPGYATTVPGLEMYKQSMEYNRMGFGCAVGVTLFTAILVLTILNNKYLHSDVEYSGT